MAETGNKFLVGTTGERVMLLRPLPQALTKADAFLLAAWLVTLAEGLPGEGNFEETLKAVRNT